MGVENMGERQKDLLLMQLMYRCTPEQRGHLMREVPDAYNAYCGSTVVEVRKTSDGTLVQKESRK